MKARAAGVVERFEGRAVALGAIGEQSLQLIGVDDPASAGWTSRA
jgi:hypothetical protein